MSIEKNRIFNNYELICDYCEDVEVYDTFQEAVQHKRDNNWRAVKTNAGAWRDLCPSCQSPDIVRKMRDD